jgi:hypothetical protein
MNQPIRLSSGNITDHHEITVILVEPAVGTPPLVQSNGRYTPQQAPPRITLLWRRR